MLWTELGWLPIKRPELKQMPSPNKRTIWGETFLIGAKVQISAQLKLGANLKKKWKEGFLWSVLNKILEVIMWFLWKMYLPDTFFKKGPAGLINSLTPGVH